MVVQAEANPNAVDRTKLAESMREWGLRQGKELGIPESRIYATGSNKAKIEKIKELQIVTHYDNNPDVIKELGSIGRVV